MKSLNSTQEKQKFKNLITTKCGDYMTSQLNELTPELSIKCTCIVFIGVRLWEITSLIKISLT